MGTTDKENLIILKNNSHLLKTISSERIRDEFTKSLKSAKSTKDYLTMLDKIGFTKLILPTLTVSKPYIDESDYIVLLSWILRKNTIDSLNKNLNKLNYTSDEIKQIVFLSSLQNFNPSEVSQFKKKHNNSGLSDSQILRYGKLISKDLKKFVKFNLSVKGNEVPSDVKGADIGKWINDLETKKFLNEGVNEGVNTKELSKKYGVQLDIYEYPDYLELSRIIVPKDKRGQGIGSKVMSDIISYAKQNKKDIFLTPSTDFGGNRGRLVKLYKSFGFKPNSGSNRDFRSKESMKLTNEMAKSDLDTIERYADSKLSPEDIEFTKHFFDRLNDPRNGKEITVGELTGFFKRLSKHKKNFIAFLSKYNDIVIKDKKTKINIPFIKQSNKVIAKTVMRKNDFKVSVPAFVFESPQTDSVDKIVEDMDLFLQKHFGIKNPITEGGDFVVCNECNGKFKQIQYRHLKYSHNMTMDEYKQKYPNSLLVSESSKSFGDKNPMKNKSVIDKHKKIMSSDTHKEKMSEVMTGKNIGNIREDLRKLNKNSEFRKKISDGVKKSYENNPELRKQRGKIGKKYGFGNKKLVDSLYEKLGWTRPEDKDEFKLYTELVRRKTNENYQKYFSEIPNAKKRSREFHLDHKLSIKDSYKMGLPISVVSHYKNLCIIGGRLNESKGATSSITLNELIYDTLDSLNPFDNRILLQCGGSYGHMNHPFDTSINLTFGQLKDIANKALDGELELTREKCVYGDAMIQTENHGEMTLREFVDGNVFDKVLAYDDQTGVSTYKDVIAKMNNGDTDEWLEIELENGQIIQVTPNHRIYVENIGYVQAQDLTEDMELKINK